MWITQLVKGAHYAKHRFMCPPLWMDKGGLPLPGPFSLPCFSEFEFFFMYL